MMFRRKMPGFSKAKAPSTESKVAGVTIFDMDFTGNVTGLSFDSHKLVYTVGDEESTTTDCCILTGSSIKCVVKVGDILISINGVPLLNNGHQDKDGFFLEAYEKEAQTKLYLKTLRFIRTSDKHPGNSPSSTHMVLTNAMAGLIFHVPSVKKDENMPWKSELNTRMQDLQSERLKFIAEMRAEADKEANGAGVKEAKIDGAMEAMLESVVAEQVEKEIQRMDNNGHMKKLTELEAKMHAKNLELRAVDWKRIAAEEEEEAKQAEALRLETIEREETEFLENELKERTAAEEAEDAAAYEMEMEIERRVDAEVRALTDAKRTEYDQKLSELQGDMTYEELVNRKASEEALRDAEDVEAEQAEIAAINAATERAGRVIENKACLDFANSRCPATATVFDITFNDKALGLRLSPYMVTCAMGGPLSTIDCCVVTRSDFTDYIQPGDILVSVNDLPLRSYRPAGEDIIPEFYPTCMDILHNEPPPRVLRYLRIPFEGPFTLAPRDVGFADAVLLLSDTH